MIKRSGFTDENSSLGSDIRHCLNISALQEGIGGRLQPDELGFIRDGSFEGGNIVVQGKESEGDIAILRGNILE